MGLGLGSATGGGQEAAHLRPGEPRPRARADPRRPSRRPRRARPGPPRSGPTLPRRRRAGYRRRAAKPRPRRCEASSRPRCMSRDAGRDLPVPDQGCASLGGCPGPEMGEAVLRAERHELVREPAGRGPLPTKLVDVAGEVQRQAGRDRMRQFPRAVERPLRGLQARLRETPASKAREQDGSGRARRCPCRTRGRAHGDRPGRRSRVPSRAPTGRRQAHPDRAG